MFDQLPGRCLAPLELWCSKPAQGFRDVSDLRGKGTGNQQNQQTCPDYVSDGDHFQLLRNFLFHRGQGESELLGLAAQKAFFSCATLFGEQLGAPLAHSLSCPSSCHR